MASQKIYIRYQPKPGTEIVLRNARVEDMRRIQVLYGETYRASYPMPLVQDKGTMRSAIESSNYFWLVAEDRGRIIGSLIYEIDPAQRIAKALGAVISPDYRKLRLANMMMKIVFLKITKEENLVDTIYATTRTVTVAPQQLTENLGFHSLGIFPNAHKVFEHETHCLAAYFEETVFKTRKTPPALIKEIEPFYRLVQKQLNLGKARFENPAGPESARVKGAGPDEKRIKFELITAPAFVRSRFSKITNSGFFATTWVPFHEPNLLMASLDQETEIYLYHGEMDKYSVILGGRTSEKNYSVLLNSLSEALHDIGVSYIELLVDAYSPELQRQALNSRFLPSAYFPAFRKVGNKKWDYVIFSRSFDMLDFRNVKIMPTYRQFLKEYLKLWKDLYVDAAFRSYGKYEISR